MEREPLTIDEFRQTLGATSPPPLAPPLRALWHEAKGAWDEAHRIAQDVSSADGAWGSRLSAPQGRRPVECQLLVSASATGSRNGTARKGVDSDRYGTVDPIVKSSSEVFSSNATR